MASKSHYFWIQAGVVGVFLILGHVAGGVVSAIYAAEIDGIARNGLAASAVSS